jgi:flavin reductase (DIM6/NTAB) family NADH-FMN oxidoreductase RutF
MTTNPPAEMPPRLVQFLLGGQTCVVATVDDQGRPMTTLMTWIVARDPRTLTVAIDTRGRSLANVRATRQIAVEVLGDDLCYGLRGVAVIEKEQMQAVPFPCALVAVHVEECRDHGAASVKFVGPRYHFHPGKEHRNDVEQAVFSELKGAPPTI